MIPHTLQIKNFLSYGSDPQTIDFRPYNLMHLSGKNGHGKSALLDAMTWAIWGHGRKTTNAVKPDQGLLRLGATHMMVVFDFVVNGQLYRIKREFIQATAKQLAYLEFGMIKDDGTIVPLTDKTIRATQDVIERTIRLDYESFVNSAFLRQGHANEFSKKSPKDRKEILSTILGLQQFEQLKKRALERVKEAAEKRNTVHAIIDTLAQQMPDALNLVNEIQQLNVQIRDVQQQDVQLQELQKNFDKEFAAYSAQQKEWELLQFKHEQAKETYQHQLRAMIAMWKQWRAIHAQQLKLPDYAALEEQKKTLFERLQAYQQLVQKRLLLQERALQLKEALQQRQRELETKNAQELQGMEVALARIKFERQMLEQQHAAGTIAQKEYATIQHAHGMTIENMQKGQTIDLTVAMAQFEKRKNTYQQFIAKANWLKSEHENLAHKTAVTHGNDPSCPLCEQNLSAARRKFLAQRFARQETFITHQLARLQTVIGRLKQLLIDQHQQLAIAKEIQSKKEALAAELVTLQHKSQETHQQLTALQIALDTSNKQMRQQEAQLKAQREKAAATIQHDAVYTATKKALHDVEKDLAACAINEHEYKNVQHHYDAITKQLADCIAIHHEIIKQAQRYEDIKKAIITLKQYKKELRNQDHMQLQQTALAQAALRCEQWHKDIQATTKALQATKEKLREEHGRLKTKQEQTERIAKERTKQQDAMQKLIKEIEDYQIIAAAAGKDGIQALLIEEAIPEIEQEANYLLSKLTNNQAHILIESLRDLKSGGSKETLDINISDPSGIRPYEMFSGGEAFRIDFALRIAISKLLARRAGTSLQTLIIDEGFGSQDEEGLSLIMDAIYKVQSDFEKVIVVSHLPSMRDQFPVHFVVEKGPNGSRISVVEQG